MFSQATLPQRQSSLTKYAAVYASANISENLFYTVIIFQPTVLLGEPFFSASVVPWHNIHFWYARSALSDLLPEKPSIVPCCATMRAIGVEFDHLWKIRAPVGNCEGFKLDTFDRIIEVKLEFVDQSSTRVPPPDHKNSNNLYHLDFWPINTPSHASDHLCQIGKESIQNCTCCGADTARCAIFQQFYCKVMAGWP